MEYIFNIDDNARYFCRVWEPDDAIKGIVFIIHGYAEHSGRYEKAGKYLSERGFKVYAPDLPGHGKTEGHRGLIEDVVAVSGNIKILADFIRKENNNLKIFLFGHSMGGGISLIYAYTFRNRLSGIITSGAAVMPLPYPPLIIRLILLFIARYMPSLKLKELGVEKISSLKDVIENYRNDPLNYNGKVQAATAVQLFRLRKLVLDNTGSIIAPILILHGSDDKLAAIQGSCKVYSSVSSEDKMIKVYYGSRHEVLNDIKQDEVLEDIKNWLLERV